MKHSKYSTQIRGFLSAIAFLAISATAAPPPGSWTLTWSDEFNGTSIDSSKWS